MRQLYIALIVSVLNTCTLFAQTKGVNFHLPDHQHPTVNHFIARDKIVLEDGFTYTASPGNKFTGELNPNLLFEPTGHAAIGGPDGTPTGDKGLVGTLPGSFNVSPTGAATYSVPIECPNGINGVKPNIFLEYNSQSALGSCGWGWNVSGLSAIRRVPKSEIFDDDKDNVNWDNTDVFTLDGVRLIKENINDNDAEQYYRSSNDPKIRIKALGINLYGPTSFEVHLANGSKLTYGLSDNSRLLLDSENYSNPILHDGVLQWNLEKEEDLFGNKIEYLYDYTTTNNYNDANQFVGFPILGPVKITNFSFFSNQILNALTV